MFSVVVVTYNHQDLVVDCLDSMLKQDYDGLELVIADDASTDDTPNVVESWAREHGSRFRNLILMLQNENSGISATHTAGVKAANGEFVKYLAGDDLMAENAVARMADFLQAGPEVEFAAGVVTPFAEDGKTGKKFYLSELPDRRIRHLFEKDAGRQFHELVLRSNFVTAAGTFFRKRALERVSYFDPEFRRFEDWHTWMKLFLDGAPIRFMNEPVSFWRRHTGAVSFGVGQLGFVQEQLRCIEKYVVPNLGRVGPFARWHIAVETKYLQTLIENGVSTQAHRKARWLRLFDPAWWMDLPRYLPLKASGADRRLYDAS